MPLVQTYLAAHDEFVAWLDNLEVSPTAAEVDGRLMALALCAADRGMTETHWTFVVDGPIAHVNRMAPGNICSRAPSRAASTSPRAGMMCASPQSKR